MEITFLLALNILHIYVNNNSVLLYQVLSCDAIILLRLFIGLVLHILKLRNTSVIHVHLMLYSR